MSGSVPELSNACCRVVVDTPAAPPNNSPNFETNLNCASPVFDKLEPPSLTVSIPINIPLSLLFENTLKTSVSIPAIAFAILEYENCPYCILISPVGNA